MGRFYIIGEIIRELCSRLTVEAKAYCYYVGCECEFAPHIVIYML